MVLVDDIDVRCYVYDVALATGRVPTIAGCARALRQSPDDIRESLHRLADAHQLVLGTNGEVLMAMPFSAVPTPFVVASGDVQAYANCGWDALGVAAMLHRDAVASTSCADCGDAMQIAVRDSHVADAAALLHFALPVRRWWESVVYT